MLEYIDMEQGSEEWYKARIASIGGTAINAIAAGGSGRKKLLYAFVGEYLTGIPAESFKFHHADRGKEFESVLRDYYSALTGNEVKEYGLIRFGPHYHISPDGIIGESGGLEIKTRIPSVMVEAITSGYTPISVRRQAQWSMYGTGREWWDYIQGCPEMMDNSIHPVIQRIYRDELPKSKREEHVTGAGLYEAAESFVAEMLKMAEQCRKA